MTLKAPFPWFGGKSRVAPEVWARFGNVPNYVEPFAGSLAVLLGRPHPPGIETVNDLDGFICNFWRALQQDPDGVTQWADNPANENDLHARHVWLVARREELQSRLEGSPDYYDSRIAGYWVWGQSCWISGGWCSGKGPWWPDAEGRLRCDEDAGQGVNRQLLYLKRGQGIRRQRLHLGSGRGVRRQHGGMLDYMRRLAARLQTVRVCSGDWSRVCGPTPTFTLGLTGVFLDPPYSAEAERDMSCYSVDSGTVAHDVRAWCLANGGNPLLRIALCGYDCEHRELENAGWTVHHWKAPGGYSNRNSAGNQNRHRERIWFSPACLTQEGTLFEEAL